MKYSVVVSVPKVTNLNKFDELRPINLMPIIDKIVEVIVHEQLKKNLCKFAGQSAVTRGNMWVRKR